MSENVGSRWGAQDPKICLVNLTQCPYDGETIEAEYSGGSFLLSCPHCRAEWELHSNIVRRVQEPDWSLVDESRRDAELLLG
ncbi:MAG: hypothetical protein ACKOZL_01505 [Actinomycetes bacterium]